MLPQKQTWVDPKLRVFGDVNVLTKVNKAISAGDGFLFNPPNPPVAIHSI
jgi:hypothetical protein